MPLLGPKIGFGPRWLQPSKLQKCAELTVPACDTGPTDGCCVVIPCTYCLQLVSPTGAKFYGTAHWNGTTWHGFVNGQEFTAYWEKYGAACEFAVVFNDVEIYRETCYAISCRDASASDTVTIDGYVWSLTWTKVEQRPLPYVTDSDGCTDHFCGDCECTCQNLCYTITTPAPDCIACTGPLPDLNNNCYGPLWQTTANCGTKSYEISLTLSRDGYGKCQFGGFVNGEDLAEVEITDCKSIGGQWVLYDGAILTVTCEPCACDSVASSCSEGCCFPYVVNYDFPCGYFIDMPYSISAAVGCNLNGATGVFRDPGPAYRKGICGPCGQFPGSEQQADGQRRYELIPTCELTPCGFPICLWLQCDNDAETPYGIDSCAGKMRLWIGTYSPLVGDVGDRPPYSENQGCTSWIKVSPSSGACLPGTAGFAGVFNVNLVVDCKTFFTTGPCIGLPTCCEPFCTSFTLTI